MLRDLENTQIRLSDALAHFPHFHVELSSEGTYIVIWTDDEILNDVLQDNYQEVLIMRYTVKLYGPMRDNVGNEGFEARGDWLAVVSIVLAVLSGRE